jgi:hypothetical protein
MPKNNRPSAAMSAAAGTSATAVLEHPHDLSADELRLTHEASGSAGTAAQANATAPAPTMLPPGTAGSTLGVGAWVTGQKVTALWSDQGARNAWMYLDPSGWKKLAGVGDTGSTAMTLLAAHARATGTAPTVDENPAGTASTLYVW